MKLIFSIQIVSLLLIVARASSYSFYNPVIQEENNPDPGVIFYEGAYYVVTTANLSLPEKFPIHRSTDLQNWEHVGFVFNSENLPTWTTKASDFWAPELHIVNGHLRVVFTAREAGTGILCIGMATASNTLGPYIDIGHPLIKNTTVGSIDATILTVEDNAYYLVWKEEGNGHTPQTPTWFWAQKLIDNGTRVKGPRHQLLYNTLPWEGDLIEGPWIIKREDWWYLFYSGKHFCDDSYAVGVARSKAPLGPYVKKGDPILKSNDVWRGPGHCSVLVSPYEEGTHVMIYHSWYKDNICGPYHRLLLVDTIYWDEDDWPYMLNSSPSINSESFLSLFN